MTTQHDSWCVHRLGSDHPNADCGRCERGDCDPAPPCDCGPEDGDYGSGYHFQSCPRYRPYRTVVR